MIQFQQPWLLIGLLLLVLPVFLWLYRRQPWIGKSTAPWLYFKQSQRSPIEKWWQRLVTKLEFWLALLTIAIIVLALAEPKLLNREPHRDLQEVCLLIDTTASMAATDGNRSPLQESKRVAIEILEKLSPTTPVTLMRCGYETELISSRSTDRAYLVKLIESLQPQGIGLKNETISDELDRVLKVTPKNSQLVYLTDHSPTTTDITDERVRWIDVGLKNGFNLGMTHVDAIRNPLQPRLSKIRIGLVCSSADPQKVQQGHVRIFLDQRPVGMRAFEIKPGNRLDLDFSLDLSKGGLLKVQLPSDDALVLDNEVQIQVPPIKPLRIGWVSDKPDPYLDLALKSIEQNGGLKLVRYSSISVQWKDPLSAWIVDRTVSIPKEQINKAIWFQTPTQWPDLKLTETQSNKQEKFQDHPILKGLNLEKLKLRSTSVPGKLQGWKALDLGPNGNSMWIQEGKEGSRYFMSTLNPSGNLAWVQQPSYPLWVSQVLSWLLEEEIKRFDIHVTASGLHWGSHESVDQPHWQIVHAQAGTVNNLLSEPESTIHFQTKVSSDELRANDLEAERKWAGGLAAILFLLWYLESWIQRRSEQAN